MTNLSPAPQPGAASSAEDTPADAGTLPGSVLCSTCQQDPNPASPAQGEAPVPSESLQDVATPTGVQDVVAAEADAETRLGDPPETPDRASPALELDKADQEPALPCESRASRQSPAADAEPWAAGTDPCAQSLDRQSEPKAPEGPCMPEMASPPVLAQHPDSPDYAHAALNTGALTFLRVPTPTQGDTLDGAQPEGRFATLASGPSASWDREIMIPPLMKGSADTPRIVRVQVKARSTGSAKGTMGPDEASGACEVAVVAPVSSRSRFVSVSSDSHRTSSLKSREATGLRHGKRALLRQP